MLAGMAAFCHHGGGKMRVALGGASDEAGRMASMIDLAEEWRKLDSVRRPPDSVEIWDERAETFTAEDAPSDYVSAFIERMALRKGESVLDMGCGAGLLSLPLARLGHPVIAADFSTGMLDRLSASLDADPDLSVRTLNMSWEDDWERCGVAARSVDVAMASRSLITHDLEGCLAKLSASAKRRVCVTVTTGLSPRVEPAAIKALGAPVVRANDALFVFGFACDLGFEPEVGYIRSPRHRLYPSPEEAREHLMRACDYLDPRLPAADAAQARARLAKWVDDHLVRFDFPQGKGEWGLDRPSHVSWAFISWDV